MNTELKSRITGVKAQMEYFDLFFGLNLGYQIFSHTDNLSKTLQAEKMSACSSKSLAEMTIKVLQSMRREQSFNSFYDTVTKKSTDYEFIKEAVNPRKRKSPNYLTMHLVDGATNQTPEFHPTTCKDRYRVIYYNVIDIVVASLKEAF